MILQGEVIGPVFDLRGKELVADMGIGLQYRISESFSWQFVLDYGAGFYIIASSDKAPVGIRAAMMECMDHYAEWVIGKINDERVAERHEQDVQRAYRHGLMDGMTQNRRN
jgi:hypothetical protein